MLMVGVLIVLCHVSLADFDFQTHYGYNPNRNLLSLSSNHNMSKLVGTNNEADGFLGTKITLCSKTYIFEKKLGAGAFGIVYLAQYINETVAIKVITNTKLGEQEVTMMELVSGHPNIIEMYCSEFRNGLTFMVMDYYPDGDLGGLSILPKEQVILLVKQLASAMAFLRSKNIVHFDIKPFNILRTGPTTFKLIDFGIAVVLQQNKTQWGGSLPYMAPELLANESYDENIDLWSIGATLYEVLSGKYFVTEVFKNVTVTSNYGFKDIADEYETYLNRTGRVQLMHEEFNDLLGGLLQLKTKRMSFDDFFMKAGKLGTHEKILTIPQVEVESSKDRVKSAETNAASTENPIIFMFLPLILLYH